MIGEEPRRALFRARLAMRFCIATPKACDRYHRGVMLHADIGCGRCKTGFRVCELPEHFCTQKAAQAAINALLRDEPSVRRWQENGVLIRQMAPGVFYARGVPHASLDAARAACQSPVLPEALDG